MHDEQRSGRPSIVIDESADKLEQLSLKDHHLTMDELHEMCNKVDTSCAFDIQEVDI